MIEFRCGWLLLLIPPGQDVFMDTEVVPARMVLKGESGRVYVDGREFPVVKV